MRGRRCRFVRRGLDAGEHRVDIVLPVRLRRRRGRCWCGGADGGAGRAGRAPARLPCAGSGAVGGALVASSSAMIRRMEARISSIDGSCDFAACVIAVVPPRTARGASPHVPGASTAASMACRCPNASKSPKPADLTFQGVNVSRAEGFTHPARDSGPLAQIITVRRECACPPTRREPVDNASSDRRSAPSGRARRRIIRRRPTATCMTRPPDRAGPSPARRAH